MPSNCHFLAIKHHYMSARSFALGTSLLRTSPLPLPTHYPTSALPLFIYLANINRICINPTALLAVECEPAFDPINARFGQLEIELTTFLLGDQLPSPE